MRFAFVSCLLVACAAPAPCPASAPAATGNAQLLANARHVTCSGYPARVSATLSSNTDATQLAGSASDNYANAQYRACTLTPSAIECAATWSSDGTSASLRVTTQPNDTFMAEIRSQSRGLLVMSCVVSD